MSAADTPTGRTDASAGRIDLLTMVGPEADRLRKIASAIREGRPGSSVRLTRLVDDVSTWTAVVPGMPPHEFDDRDDAMEWASDVASLIQARAVAAALSSSAIRPAGGIMELIDEALEDAEALGVDKHMKWGDPHTARHAQESAAKLRAAVAGLSGLPLNVEDDHA